MSGLTVDPKGVVSLMNFAKKIKFEFEGATMRLALIYTITTSNYCP